MGDSDEPAALEAGEFVVGDRSEVLRRQVHPSFFDKGQPSSQAFGPTKKDSGKLSTRREAMSAEEAYRQHVGQGNKSVGTWGISVQEVEDSTCRVVDDSALAESPDYHAYVDFRHLSNSASDKVAKKLKAAAIARGCLYRPIE